MMVQSPPELPTPPPPPEVIVHNIGAGSIISEEVLFASVVVCILIGAVYILGPIAKASGSARWTSCGSG